jgi:hypothetical protein
VHRVQIARQGKSCEKCAKLFFLSLNGLFVSPTGQYSTRLADRNARLARFDALNARIESTRLGVGATFLIIAWLCFGPAQISALWLTIPLLGFIALLVYHQRIRNRRTQRPMERQGHERRALRGPAPHLRRRPGSVRHGQSVRTALRGAHPAGREHPGAMAARAGDLECHTRSPSEHRRPSRPL